MSPFPVVDALSILTIVGQLLSLVCIVLLLTKQKSVLTFLSDWLSSHGLLLMFILALTATSGSLFFSDIAGWTPCKLCWFQRIFMYPQVLLLGLALWQKDRRIARYIILLSVIGLVFAAFHYGEQVNVALHPVKVDLLKPCDATGVSCAKTPIFAFGYITIPLMAFTAFLLNIFGSLFVLRSWNAQV
jgi:disulfide bond formation protein DsbB